LWLIQNWWRIYDEEYGGWNILEIARLVVLGLERISKIGDISST
jgi:hypothetical protein